MARRKQVVTDPPDIKRGLSTRKGDIVFPAYIPVTTFGDKYPLDDLIRPYLPRLSQAIMVSVHYAKSMTTPPRIPMLVDSGGFACLFEKATITKRQGLGIIELRTENGTEVTDPLSVLELQEQIADVAFTLDFPIPPGTSGGESKKRLDLTIANALWALHNRRRTDLPLYAVVQAWDKSSARKCARAYKGHPFDGVAIGGLVPRARDHQLLLEIIGAVRSELPHLPLHVFGLGAPNVLPMLYKAGVDSVDSSSYVKLAADGRLWNEPRKKFVNLSPTDRLHLALCNLATAANRTLPLSTATFMFSTHSLLRRASTSRGEEIASQGASRKAPGG